MKYFRDKANKGVIYREDGFNIYYKFKSSAGPWYILGSVDEFKNEMRHSIKKGTLVNITIAEAFAELI